MLRGAGLFPTHVFCLLVLPQPHEPAVPKVGIDCPFVVPPTGNAADGFPRYPAAEGASACDDAATGAAGSRCRWGCSRRRKARRSPDSAPRWLGWIGNTPGASTW